MDPMGYLGCELRFCRFLGHKGLLIGYLHHPVLERVLYEDCTNTLLDAFFKTPGAHH